LGVAGCRASLVAIDLAGHAYEAIRLALVAARSGFATRAAACSAATTTPSIST
jgi:hypothetical protein